MLDRVSTHTELRPEDFPDWFAFHDAWLLSPAGQAAHSPEAVAAREAIRIEHLADLCPTGPQIDAHIRKCAAARFGVKP